MKLYICTCTRCNYDSKLLLPLYITLVKYRRLHNMPLEILCLSVFMIDASGMFFRRPGALVMLQLYDIYLSLFEVCTRVRFQVCQRISFRRISVQSRVKKQLVIFQKLARNSAKDFCYAPIVGPKNKEGIKRKNPSGNMLERLEVWTSGYSFPGKLFWYCTAEIRTW